MFYRNSRWSSGGAQLKRNPDTPALLRSGFLNEIVDFPGGVCGLQAGSGSLQRANAVVQPRRLRRTTGSQPEVKRRVAGGDRLVTGLIRKWGNLLLRLGFLVLENLVVTGGLFF